MEKANATYITFAEIPRVAPLQREREIFGESNSK
jgi:hypothetical protein